MAISVTTRISKGSPLTYLEADTNFDNLAVSATDAAEGNIRLATQAEANSRTDATTAISPGTLNGAVDAYLANKPFVSNILFTGSETSGDNMLSWFDAGMVTVVVDVGFAPPEGHHVINIPSTLIVINENWNLGIDAFPTLAIRFTSNTRFQINTPVAGVNVVKIAGWSLL